MKPLQKCLLILIAISMVAGCSEDTTSPNIDPDVLLTLHFSEDYLSERESGRVFASDLQGNLLDEASWHGEASVVLKNSTVHPDSISFTIIWYGSYSSMKTEWGVPAGSTRSYDSSPYISYPSSAIHFLNAPDCDRYVISSPGFSSYHTENIPASKSMEIRGDSSDVFVGIHPTQSAPLGGWVRGVQADYPDTLDFSKPSATSLLTAYPILLPEGGSRFICWLHSFCPDSPERDSVLFDRISVQEVVPETVILHGPEFNSQEHRLIMYFKDSSGVSHRMENWGEVPLEFLTLEGDLTVFSTSVDSFVFERTGQWDHFSSKWESDIPHFGTWTISGSAPFKALSLPQLPAWFSEIFDGATNEGFYLESLEIIQGEEGDMILTEKTYFPR